MSINRKIICDENGVIIKLAEKSVIQFLYENKRPLILYGMGEKGQFILEAMDKLNIEVSLVVDGDRKKQGTVLNGREISSLDTAKRKYPNAIVWISIADIEIRKPIERLISESGFFPILTFDLQDPMSEGAYIDIEETYPYLLIGNNIYSNKLQGYLNQQNLNTLGIIDDISLTHYMNCDFKNMNVIICDHKKWISTISWLHEHGVYENIYSFLRGDFGIFRVEKYHWLSVHLRYIFRILFASLNGMNKQMMNEASQRYFQEINYRCIYNLHRSNFVIEETEELYEQIVKLRWRLQQTNNKKEKAFQKFIIDIGEGRIDIFSYLKLLLQVYERCICYSRKVMIQIIREDVFEIY